MATQLVELVLTEKLSLSEILQFLPKDNRDVLRERFNITSVSSEKFIYGLITFLRDQSCNVLENNSQTVSVNRQRKDEGHASSGNRGATAPNRNLSGISRMDLSGNVTTSPRPDESFLAEFDSSLMLGNRSAPPAFFLEKNDFPCLMSTPKKDSPKAANASFSGVPPRGPTLVSTPLRASKGNLGAATTPDIAERIFDRKLQTGNRAGHKAKRASLTSQLAKAPTAPSNPENLPASPKKRIQPKPAPPWRGAPVLSDFVIPPEVGQSPREATKKQREMARTMRQEAASPATPAPKPVPVYDTPSLTKVTRLAELDRLADLYSTCLLRNYVPNLLLELQFILELFVARIEPAASRPDLLLGTASNCGYFAVQVMLQCSPILACLDVSTLQLLRQVPHLRQMNEALYAHIDELCNRERNFSVFRSSFIQGVSFDVSVDNAENFTSQNLFGAFRRQRDHFYELLKDWQETTFNYHKNDLRFGHRVRAIFELSMDPCNLLHLAQLFVAQLVSTCCGGLETDRSGNVSEKAVQELRSRSPEKFSKLTSRLEQTTSSRVCSQYRFDGQQVFFQNFIVEANYAQFHAMLKAVLVERINEADRHNPVLEDLETSIDSQVREDLYTYLYRLRLYGAFLGFIEFLPFASNPSTSSPIVPDQHLRLREGLPMPIDLVDRLDRATREQRLILTVPWVCTFLSLADEAVSQLASYSNVWKRLAGIFRACGDIDLYSMVLRFLIGSLFHDLSMTMPFTGYAENIELKPGLETFVDTQLFHMVCPFVADLRSVVACYFSPNSTEIRKIAPIPLCEPEKPQFVLADQMEEAFFFVHPASVKRVVTFIAERIPADLVRLKKPELTSQFRAEVKELLRQVSDSGESVTPKMINTLAQNLRARLQLKAENVLVAASDAKMNQLLELLLEVDCGPDGLTVAKRLCAKQCHARLLQWIRSHVTQDYLKDLVRQCCKDVDEDVRFNEAVLEAKSVDRHRTCDAVARVLDALQHLLKEVLAGPVPEAASGILETARQSLLNRREWTKPAWQAVEGLLLDIGFACTVRSRSNRLMKVVLAIFNETGLSIGYTVDSARNRRLIETLLGGCDEPTKALLAEYQAGINGVRSSASGNCPAD